MTQRYVVTGAAGFIGRRLCGRLRESGEVMAVLHGRAGGGASRTGPWDDACAVDVARDEFPPGVFRSADVVFHLAGRAHTVTARRNDAGEYTRVNVEGTRRVVAAARAADVRRFVFASSVKAMGEGDGGATLSAYGRSKREAEQLLRDGGLREFVVLRLALVYGPGVEGNLGNMLRAVRARRFPPPPPGPNRRAMVHVDDVVRVMLAAGADARAAGCTFVVGDGVPYTTRSIYDAMRAALGRRGSTWSLPAPCWRALAALGDAWGAMAGRRAPFDSEAHRKLFGSAWYETSDVQAALGVPPFRTLEDALTEMAAPR